MAASWIVRVTCLFSVVLSACGGPPSSIPEKGGEATVSSDSTTEIVDPIPDTPFRVVSKPNLEPSTDVLPPSASGHVVFSYSLGATGTVVQVEIMKLFIQTAETDTLTNYVRPYDVSTQDYSYPSEAQKYVPWLLDYARSVQFEATDNTGNVKLGRVQLMVRF